MLNKKEYNNIIKLYQEKFKNNNYKISNDNNERNYKFENYNSYIYSSGLSIIYMIHQRKIKILIQRRKKKIIMIAIIMIIKMKVINQILIKLKKIKNLKMKKKALKKFWMRILKEIKTLKIIIYME